MFFWIHCCHCSYLTKPSKSSEAFQRPHRPAKTIAFLIKWTTLSLQSIAHIIFPESIFYSQFPTQLSDTISACFGCPTLCGTFFTFYYRFHWTFGVILRKFCIIFNKPIVFDFVISFLSILFIGFIQYFSYGIRESDGYMSDEQKARRYGANVSVNQTAEEYVSDEDIQQSHSVPEETQPFISWRLSLRTEY